MYLPFALIPIMFGWVIWNKLKFNKMVEDNADKCVGAIANRLGMQVVEGDPNQNLLIFQEPMGNFERTFRATGAPYGRPTEFWVVDGRKKRDFIVATHTTLTYGSRLEVPTTAGRVFEVLLRTPNKYLVIAPEYEHSPLSEISIGVPTLDQLFVVRSQDPSVGAALVGALTLLATHHYVHLACDGQKLWIKWERMGLGYFAASAEEYLLALETAACGLEGRQAPIPTMAATAPHGQQYAQPA